MLGTGLHQWGYGYAHGGFMAWYSASHLGILHDVELRADGLGVLDPGPD